MKFQAIKKFRDLEDKANQIYDIGDVYPKEGIEVTNKRLDELLGTKNRLGYAVIEKVEVEEAVEEVEVEAEATEAETKETAETKPKKTDKVAKKDDKNGDVRGKKAKAA